jgi:hypothetical protein
MLPKIIPRFFKCRSHLICLCARIGAKGALQRCDFLQLTVYLHLLQKICYVHSQTCFGLPATCSATKVFVCNQFNLYAL